MSWQIVCDEVKHWAENYSGPKFHAILTDPPYHLYSDTRGITRYNGAMQQKWRNRKATSGFMGKQWDGGGISFDAETWYLLAQHLHPGGFIISFASGRGYHRVMVAMEDAGLEMHHNLFLWAQGQGFPKVTRIDTQVDKVAGAEREVVGRYIHPGTGKALTPENMKGSTNPNPMDWGKEDGDRYQITAPATPLAATWAGHRYGQQSLKPCVEPIILCQHPYDGRPIDNIVETGAGCLNIDGCRLGGGLDYLEAGWGERFGSSSAPATMTHGGGDRPWIHDRLENEEPVKVSNPSPLGRWPSNFILCHTPECIRIGTKEVKNTSGSKTGDEPSPVTKYVYGGRKRTAFSAHGKNGIETVDEWECVPECPVRLVGEMSGESKSSGGKGIASQRGALNGLVYQGGYSGEKLGQNAGGLGDTGTATRFFYQADWSLDVAENLLNSDGVFYVPKVTSPKERNAGLGEQPDRIRHRVNSGGLEHEERWAPTIQKNPHPTLKPITLTKYLGHTPASP